MKWNTWAQLAGAHSFTCDGGDVLHFGILIWIHVQAQSWDVSLLLVFIKDFRCFLNRDSVTKGNPWIQSQLATETCGFWDGKTHIPSKPQSANCGWLMLAMHLISYIICHISYIMSHIAYVICHMSNIFVMSRHVPSRQVTSRHVTSRHVMSSMHGCMDAWM